MIGPGLVASEYARLIRSDAAADRRSGAIVSGGLVESLSVGRSGARSDGYATVASDGVVSWKSSEGAEDNFVDVGSLAARVRRFVKIENFAVFDYSRITGAGVDSFLKDGTIPAIEEVAKVEMKKGSQFIDSLVPSSESGLETYPWRPKPVASPCAKTNGCVEFKA